MTGASGLVGSAVIQHLDAGTLTVLAHRAEPRASRSLTVLRGDITDAYLGLPRSDFERLAAATDRVVHCAAVIDATASPSRMHEANVVGTERVLEFCAAADADLVYVGTAASHPDLGRDVPVERFSALPYLRSKQDAEVRVRASGLPVAIAKSSLVIGDRVSGEVTRFQGLYIMAKLLLQGSVDVIPLDEDSRIDFIPRDIAAKTLAVLANADSRCAGDWWLTAGAEAVTARRLIELLSEFSQSSGLGPVSPRFVAPEVIDRLFRPALLPELPRRLKSRMEYMIELSKPFTCGAEYPSSLRELLPDAHVPTQGQLEDTWSASLRFWHQRGTALVEPRSR